MNDPRQRGREHTWDIVIDYHRCPKCGYIMENRDKYEHRLGTYQKDLICSQCRHSFIAIKKHDPNRKALIDID